ncbi:hypothetical protein [Paenibacillus daejeonensis]|uniref:hypothetical protein n=1 Tax=Paenibacillus daejeonensis TaxID=135193 RepID=UPI0003AA390B|nr:hypothetical protein [Paenibacillus daejeonensis]
MAKTTKKMAPSPKMHEREVSTAELAAIIGKTPRWINQLTGDGILKRVGRGKYILSEAVQAYIDHASGGREEDTRPRLRDEQAELTRIRKEDAMLDLAVKRGELHRAEDVRATVTDMLLNFRARMLALPMKIAPRVAYLSDVQAINGVLDGEIRVALITLSDYDPTDYKEGASDERDSSADT